jgi:hypothetical protein
MENITPKLENHRQLILLGIGALCAGIIIGFKLAGGEKVVLDETPATIVEYVIEPDEQEAVEND